MVLAGLLAPALAAKEAPRRITVDTFEPARLGAAIFAETNRVRALHQRPKLRPQSELSAAAADHAGTMALRLRPTHEGPFSGRENAWERVKSAGLEPEVVTENVSAISLPVSDSPETWADGYEPLAAVIVQAWMESPGHRKNLLSRDVTHLGCAARLARVPASPARVFSVQVFCRPKNDRWKLPSER